MPQQRKEQATPHVLVHQRRKYDFVFDHLRPLVHVARHCPPHATVLLFLTEGPLCFPEHFPNLPRLVQGLTPPPKVPFAR